MKNNARYSYGYNGTVPYGRLCRGDWKELNLQIYLGSEAFITHMQEISDNDLDAPEIPRQQREPLPENRPLSYYQQHYPEKEAIAIAYLTGDHTQKSIADFFGIHYSTVSRLSRKYSKNNEASY
jgi:putative transposase